MGASQLNAGQAGTMAFILGDMTVLTMCSRSKIIGGKVVAQVPQAIKHNASQFQETMEKMLQKRKLEASEVYNCILSPINSLQCSLQLKKTEYKPPNSKVL